MSGYAGLEPHGSIEQVFGDVYFVSGRRRWDFQNMLWQFSRNMTVVRDGGELTLFNAVRLGDDGLAKLESLGNVTNVVQLGALHGIDDAFYKDRYQATYWALPGGGQESVTVDERLEAGGAVPVSDGSLFVFEQTNIPECILRLDRDGGIVIACDALQNWNEPDEFFSEDSKNVMTEMGFFQKANIGPVWMQAAEPQAADFERLKQLSFRHALCGHGEPLRDTAHEDYAATFNRIFGI